MRSGPFGTGVTRMEESDSRSRYPIDPKKETCQGQWPVPSMVSRNSTTFSFPLNNFVWGHRVDGSPCPVPTEFTRTLHRVLFGTRRCGSSSRIGTGRGENHGPCWVRLEDFENYRRRVTKFPGRKRLRRWGKTSSGHSLKRPNRDPHRLEYNLY